MKKTSVIAMLIVVIFFACVSCSVPPGSGQTPENSAIASPSGVESPFAPATPSQATAPAPQASTEVPEIGPDEKVADALAVLDHWYDWDKLGAPPISRPMCNLVESDDSIFYISYSENALIRTDLNAANKATLAKGAVKCVNFLGGWVYYSTPEGIFKIKPDGTQNTMIMENGALDFVTAEGTIYFVDMLGCMGKVGTDGQGYEELDDDALFLEYDDGAIYFGQGGTENYEGQADIARYDIVTGKKAVLAKNVSWASGVTVFRGTLYYIDDDGNITLMDVKDKTKKTIATAGTPAEDPFLLSVFGDFIICVSRDDAHDTNSIFRVDAASGEVSKIVNDPGCDDIYPSRKNLYTYSSVTDEYSVIRPKADGAWEKVSIGS